MRNRTMHLITGALAFGLLAGCASGPAPQVRTEVEPAREYRYITGSHIKREVTGDAEYPRMSSRVRVITEEEIRQTGSNNLAEVLYRSGIF